MIDYILSNINEDIVTKLGLHNYRIEEDTELIDTEEGKYPVVRDENGFKRISLDDAFEYVLYHRVTAEPSTVDEEKSFGTKITYENVITAKMVVATKTVTANGWNRNRGTPERNTTGKNTMTKVTVETRIGSETSCVPSNAACIADLPIL